MLRIQHNTQSQHPLNTEKWTFWLVWWYCCITKTRERGRRSFKLELSNQNISKSVSSNRIRPLPKEIPETVDNPLFFAGQNKNNFLWAIMRHHFSENQVIPSWAGFNITMHGNLAVLKSSVNYLDCIDSTATDISIIYQVCQPTITTFYNSAVKFARFFWDNSSQKTSTKSSFGEIKDT